MAKFENIRRQALVKIHQRAHCLEENEGKPEAIKTDEFPEKFQMGGRGGSFPIQKIILQISLYIEDIFDSKIVPKCADVNGWDGLGWMEISVSTYSKSACGANKEP